MTVKNEILVGVDGSHHSDSAVVWAAAEAASRGAGLMIVHAFDANSVGLWTTTASIRASLREMTQPIIDDALKLVATHQPSVRARGRVLIGSPTRMLLLLSAGVELTVVGRSGRGALARVWLGSITQRVLAHASSPAIAVGAGAAGGRVSRIVVGMSESPAEAPVLQFAFEMAQRRHATLDAIHVVRQAKYAPGEAGGDLKPEPPIAEDQQVEALVTWQVKFPDVALSSLVRRGQPGPVLAAACGPDDVLVLGHHRHAPFTPHQLGPAATAALHDSPCSVAVVHEPVENVPLSRAPDSEPAPNGT